MCAVYVPFLYNPYVGNVQQKREMTSSILNYEYLLFRTSHLNNVVSKLGESAISSDHSRCG